ncbi:hypothetical protein AB0M36_25600 [Actinoplanes sp. NPDC051346]|uniref:magnesium transporter MgtE N-terminal domain-containing protein n=1 Tax=Actinoplanes sp. NPDC051346 TaxID=3155048 RepID=UPI00341AB0D6
MPTEHVVTMLNATPPQRAVGVLLGMPSDRVDALLGAMDGRLIAKLLIAAEPERRATLLGHLDDARLSAELALLPLVEAAAVLAALPAQRARPQLERVSSENLALLLDAMPGLQRRRLVDVLEPSRLADLRRVGYSKRVIESLRRTAAGLQFLDDQDCDLLAGVLHRLFGVALRYVDAGPLHPAAIAAAQRAFAAQQVHGLLIVTNAMAGAEAMHLAAHPRDAEIPTLVITWDPDDNDGVLGRALVRLAG